jgi:hypothetical protein
MGDNAPLTASLGKGVHTHLKGRIFSAEGTSYLVLSETQERPEWLRVKALNAQRTVQDMHSEEIERHLSRQEWTEDGPI